MSQDNQLKLFDDGNGKRRPRYEKFRKFHHANPGVFLLFTKFSEQALMQGRRDHYGARMIGEKIRWYTQIDTTGG